MNRRSGGSSAFESIDPAFEPPDVRVRHGHFRDPFGDPFGRVRQSRPDGEQVFLHLLDQPADVPPSPAARGPRPGRRSVRPRRRRRPRGDRISTRVPPNSPVPPASPVRV